MMTEASTAQNRVPLSFTFTEGERRVFRRREPITVSEWAERHRIVERGPSPGKWSNAVTPYLREIMDCWNMPWVRKIILCFAPQTGKTQVAFNCLGYAIDQDPGPAMYVMPNEKVMKRISRRRIIPMVRRSPRLSALLSMKAFDTTAYHITFRNGMDLMMAWATSAAELSSESVRYLIMDETDKWPDDAGKEADPIALAEMRTNAYPHTKKILYLSTPTDDTGNISRIVEKEADEIRRYHVPCPVCGEHQIMVFDQIVWPKDVREPRRLIRERLARYACVKCGMLWTDAMRNDACRKGKWIADNPVFRPLAVAFHLPSWYSPFLSLSEPAAAFLRGLNDPGKLQIFVTQHKAEPWKQVIVAKKHEELLKARVDLPPQVVPMEAVALTCGVDQQLNGYWFVVRAWARDMTSWLIHYGFLPTEEELDHLIFETRYPRMDGKGSLWIWRVARDTGGGSKGEGEMTMTEEAYWWTVRNWGRGPALFATKGSSKQMQNRFKQGEPLLRTQSGKPLPNWFKIVSINTVMLKDYYHYGIQQAIDKGPNALYLHSEVGKDYFDQVTAEEKRIEKKVAKWVAKGANHLLDCEVLAVSLAMPQWPGGGVNIVRGIRGASEDEETVSNSIRTRVMPQVARSKWMES